MRTSAVEAAGSRVSGGSNAIADDSGASLAIVGAAATLVTLAMVGVAVGGALSVACMTPAAVAQFACIAG